MCWLASEGVGAPIVVEDAVLVPRVCFNTGTKPKIQKREIIMYTNAQITNTVNQMQGSYRPGKARGQLQ